MNCKKGENPVNNTPVETERKYLIRYPDTEALARMDGAQIWHIVQTYLCTEGVRVRRIEEDGAVRFIRTEKKRLSALSSFEDEWEITEAEYRRMLADADPERHPVEKTRYRIPWEGYLCEIDVYSFWNDRATLEIELPTEDIRPPMPPFVTLIREVSGDKRYTNRAMAKEIPVE
ncbi:MAG: hypothetical protein E7662_05290 [Ruminococcaceae bacterium]|nr:hypothetical protein [Oscillospiraceae bacterium]